MFVMLCIFRNQSGGLVLAIIMGSNLAYGIYIAGVKPLEKRSLNWQEIYNEFVLSASTYWKILYTDVV